ncbi:NADH-quinone oxidoreductase subunit C [Kitasatospora sp. GP82]|uniref:NADH-quinone oxidoreductase subunit C n=1 Tax=Kitasatospora sp. GP82 TaxID=3035089 RepID=UPI002472F85B|nr:NADH-quinone oxidoreductase subunit C [Kitasatospora sp. GP82]MDH6124363.1 NADH-quinone oxidoreductase subunit C [Kitasatospora sp. GP82]
MIPVGAEEVAAAIGEWATAGEAYELLTVDVPAEHWIEALTAARDGLGLGFFDWLSAVDELAEGFSVAAHLAAPGEPGVRHLVVRTRIPREGAVLPTAVEVYAGAAWHERETHEMFGIDFTGHPHLVTLLLPDGFEGHPLRKEFVLAARVAKDWPGAKEPGESDHGGGPARRKMQPAGVPDPNEWGPLKGTLPPAAERPARVARGPRAAAGAAAGAAASATEGGPAVRADRPRRTRTIGDGSVSQAAPAGETAPGEGGAPIRADRPRRTRSISEGSVSQAAPAGEAGATGEAGEAGVSAEQPQPSAPGRPTVARTQSSDAPWHAPVPAEPASAEPRAVDATSAEQTPDEKTPAPEAPPTQAPAQDGDST